MPLWSAPHSQSFAAPPQYYSLCDLAPETRAPVLQHAIFKPAALTLGLFAAGATTVMVALWMSAATALWPLHWLRPEVPSSLAPAAPHFHRVGAQFSNYRSHSVLPRAYAAGDGDGAEDQVHFGLRCM